MPYLPVIPFSPPLSLSALVFTSYIAPLVIFFPFRTFGWSLRASPLRCNASSMLICPCGVTPHGSDRVTIETMPSGRRSRPCCCRLQVNRATCSNPLLLVDFDG
uniref:Uncharacterized protein n=1 Tax=Schistocephalus solidus TaxID=70667 RepID=A0A0X3Q2C0_SCHSO